MSGSSFFRAVAHCFRTLSAVVFDLVRLALLAAHSRSALAAENLFLRKKLALFQERKVKPRRAHDSAWWMMATLSRMFQWRDALVNVKPDTLLRWHRKGFRLFWRWKSKPTGRPRLTRDLRDLIWKMAMENPSWGEERIANELKLKLGIQVSPRTVGKYVHSGGPRREPDPETALADLRPESRQSDRGVRLLRRDHGDFPHPLRIRDHGTGNTSNSPPERDCSPDCGVDLAAVPGGASGRPSVSVRDPRQGQHLLEAIGQGSDGPRRESSSNSRAGTHGKLHMRTVRRDITSRVPGLPNSAQRTPPESDYQRMGLHYNRGRPHSSLGPGIPEPNQDCVPASDDRHKLPAGYRVVKTSVLGGLYHEYRLVKEPA